LQERNSIEKDSNNNTPYAVGSSSMVHRLWDRQRNKNNRGITMTTYETMLKSKENTVRIMTDFCVAILSEISEEEIPEKLREALRVKIAMYADDTLKFEDVENEET
jgi:hypothetical protein